ncbi:hypothetical protein DM01DRAFT_1316070 [Hesseltinella vesiculosa]|uniref:Uncharacterized protein n=1 Tax=Hesseltinella vesiculosa TaxID=101127 RepID=A0A1X2GTP6_9FUNG|nr:hypothetical protein DM01DRAFT_1316070 [Hesseltinella vesiculosa]
MLSLLLCVTAVLSCASADFLPSVKGVPTAADVKERIAPPEGQHLYDVWYAKGNRIYQCNPELTGFQHWYNVQTHAFLYPTAGREAPFDIDGEEIGQISAAPLNKTEQMANPVDTYPTIYYFPDGSWTASGHPLATTTKEDGRVERGDAVNLDDHLEQASYSSTNGYLSHANYVVRLQSLDGVVPAADTCKEKGAIVNKPFTAYFMAYTDEEGLAALKKEKEEWDALSEKYNTE